MMFTMFELNGEITAAEFKATENSYNRERVVTLPYLISSDMKFRQYLASMKVLPGVHMF